MANHKWDLKSNYMLTFTVCKYGLNPERWNLIADDLADFINTTPQNCKTQFGVLCQQYDEEWQKKPSEQLQTYIFSIIKRLYYGDLCERMTESRDLLMVMYDFIRLFKGGRITPNDINEILQDVKNTVITGNDTNDHDRQQKIKILERFKLHMANQPSQTSGVRAELELHSSFPVELLPPPPFFHQQSLLTDYIPPEQFIPTTTDNDRQVPSVDYHQKSSTMTISSFPIIIQSNNLLIENEHPPLNNNQSNEVDIDEIELSSDDSHDRTPVAHISTIDESGNNSNLINDQDESTFISDEQVETNESSNIPAIPNDVSNSNDKDLYENVSTTSLSNQSTFDTRLSIEERATSSISGQPIPSNRQLNTSLSGSSDYVTLDSDQIQQTQMQYDHSIETTPRRIPVEDDEVARMDAEQIPETIPADITDVAAPNDNAIFIVDEFVSNTDTPAVLTINMSEQSGTSDGNPCESEGHENSESTTTRNSQRQSRVRTSSSSHNYRKSIASILNNLKDAKYGSDFAKSLKSFKLPDEYYFRIKQPLDIPEIRERMNNGDYDDNILLFERDILLMFTNALSIYHRDINIHEHAQYMLNYALELLTPMEEVVTPWKNAANSASVFRFNNENDSDDNALNQSSNASTSSIRGDLSARNSRRPASSYHPMPKRQRKTTH